MLVSCCEPGVVVLGGEPLKDLARAAPSSRGLGRRPFKPETGIRIPVGLPLHSLAAVSQANAWSAPRAVPRCATPAGRRPGRATWVHSSAGEHLLHTQGVAGSNPAAPTASLSLGERKARSTLRAAPKCATRTGRPKYAGRTRRTGANSSVGRALALHASGHRFEPCFAHYRTAFAPRKQCEGHASSCSEACDPEHKAVRNAEPWCSWFSTLACQARGRGFESRRLRHSPLVPGQLSRQSVPPRLAYLNRKPKTRAGIAQLVEHGTENPGVPSSSLGPGTS